MPEMSYEWDVAAASQAPQLVVIERQDARATVTLDDPDRLNPLSAALTVQLTQALSELADDAGARAVVLTGRDPCLRPEPTARRSASCCGWRRGTARRRLAT
jgi:1,4-dihydroxy-2-naphthoyl-CoA synthase